MAACESDHLDICRYLTAFPASQLTVQEISTMIRLRLKPIIFVINNNGYTIERCIHGKDRCVAIKSWRKLQFAYFNYAGNTMTSPIGTGSGYSSSSGTIQ